MAHVTMRNLLHTHACLDKVLGTQFSTHLGFWCLELFLKVRVHMSSLASEDTQRTDPMFILYLVGAVPIRRLEIKALMMGEAKCCTAAQ